MAAEVYLALNSSTAKMQAVQAAAEVALAEAPRQKAIFSAILKVINTHSKGRNKIAHGTFGLVEELPGVLAWVDPVETIKLGDGLNFDKVFIYTKDELEKIINAHYQICAIGQNFSYILRNHVANQFGQIERELVLNDLLKPNIKDWEQFIQ